jgi:hypothetical protein
LAQLTVDLSPVKLMNGQPSLDSGNLFEQVLQGQAIPCPYTFSDLVQQFLSSPGSFVPLLLKGGDPTAIFGWTGSLPTHTDGINLLRRKRKNTFQPDLVFPLVSEVILVEKPFSEPKLEIGQADLMGILIKT